MMHYRNDFDGSDFLSNAFTDSDWASNKGARKCFCMLLDDGQLLIELWKSEIKVLLHYPQLKAETCAATSQDHVMLGSLLDKTSFLLEVEVSIKLLVDKSARRYILSRAGCGRVRHLSTRILWMQQRVERKELLVGAVSSSAHAADIGMKRLSVPTMKYLMYKQACFITCIQVYVYYTNGFSDCDCLIARRQLRKKRSI